MKKPQFFSTVLVTLFFALLLQNFALSQTRTETPLTYIRSIDLVISLVGEESAWCGRQVLLRFETGDDVLFDKHTQLAASISALGRIFIDRCPRVQELLITGNLRGERVPVFGGIATKEVGRWSFTRSDPDTVLAAYEAGLRNNSQDQAIETSSSDADINEAFDPADYLSSEKPAGFNISLELALRTIANSPDMIENDRMVARWFEEEFPSRRFGAGKSNATQTTTKYYGGTDFDRRDVITEFRSQLRNRATQTPFKIAFAHQVRIFASEFDPTRGIPIHYGNNGSYTTAPAVLEEEEFYIEHLGKNTVVQFDNVPDISHLPLDEAKARELAVILQENPYNRIYLRYYVTYTKVGYQATSGNFPVLISDGSLDAVDIYIDARDRSGITEPLMLYRWSTRSNGPALNTNSNIGSIEAFANWSGIPVNNGRYALYRGLEWDDPSGIYDRRESIESAWGKLFLFTQLAQNQPILEEDEVALQFGRMVLTERQRTRISHGKSLFDNGAADYDEFEYRDVMRAFREQYTPTILSIKPTFPIPLVEVTLARLGKYDFSRGGFPISYRNVHGDDSNSNQTKFSAFANQTRGDYFPGAPTSSNLARMPDFLEVDEQIAPDFLKQLKARPKFQGKPRVVYIAIFGVVNQQEGLKNNLQYDIRFDRIAMFSDTSLTGTITEFNFASYGTQLPSEAENTQQQIIANYNQIARIEITPEVALVPIADDFLPKIDFLGEFVKSGNAFGGANEFSREDVYERERFRIAALKPSEPTFWLGGKIVLGEFDREANRFEVKVVTLQTGSNPEDYFSGEVVPLIANLADLSYASADASSARSAVGRVSGREFAIRVRVRPTIADYELEYGDHPNARLEVVVEELFILVPEGENKSDHPFILSHIVANDGELSGANSTEIGQAENNPNANRMVLNPDVIGLLAVREIQGPIPEQMLRQLYLDRWYFEKEFETSIAAKFFHDNSRPNNLSFRRHRKAFEDWLREQSEKLPDQFTIRWEPNQWNFVRSCNDLGQMDGHYPSLTGFMDNENFVQWFETYSATKSSGTRLGPVLATPVLMRPSAPPSNEYNSSCDPNGRDSLANELKIVDGADHESVVVVNELPVFDEDRFSLAVAEIDARLNKVAIVANNDGIPHVRVFVDFEEIRYFKPTNDADGNAIEGSSELVATFDTETLNPPQIEIQPSATSETAANDNKQSIDDLILQGASQTASEAPQTVSEPSHVFGPDEYIISFAISDSGGLALLGFEDGLSLWNIETGQKIRSLIDYGGWVYNPTWSPDGRYALSEHDDGIKLWNLITGEVFKTFPINTSKSGAGEGTIRFLPDGSAFLMISKQNQLKLIDISTGNEIRVFYDGIDSSASLVLSPDGQIIAVGSSKNIAIWDIESGELIRKLVGHTNGVTSVAFSHDGRFVVSGSDDNSVKLWDLASGREIRTFVGHKGGISGVAITRDGRLILSASEVGNIKIWAVATGRLLRTYAHHQGGINGPVLSPDENTFYTTHYEVKAWSLEGF